jgi:hypothetical protein
VVRVDVVYEELAVLPQLMEPAQHEFSLRARADDAQHRVAVRGRRGQ